MIQQILSCDWGTSSFRLRLINLADNTILAETISAKGMAAVYNEWLQSKHPTKDRINFYRDVLLAQIEDLTNYPLPGIPIIISGMASSAIGMMELPYGDVPFTIDVANLDVMKIPPDENCTHEILLVSGLKTLSDVMRGEESILAGCDLKGNSEQLIIFPGTHSKHVMVKNKTLIEFKTYMTGEVFDLLIHKSILSKSVTKNESNEYDSVFERGVKEGASGNLLNIIFHVRTNNLFNTLIPEENYHYLSGLLIGAELKEVPFINAKIHLLCDEKLSAPYLRALQVLCISEELEYSNADEALINCHCKLAALFYDPNEVSNFKR